MPLPFYLHCLIQFVGGNVKRGSGILHSRIDCIVYACVYKWPNRQKGKRRNKTTWKLKSITIDESVRAIRHTDEEIGSVYTITDINNIYIWKCEELSKIKKKKKKHTINLITTTHNNNQSKQYQRNEKKSKNMKTRKVCVLVFYFLFISYMNVP